MQVLNKSDEKAEIIEVLRCLRGSNDERVVAAAATFTTSSDREIRAHAEQVVEEAHRTGVITRFDHELFLLCRTKVSKLATELLEELKEAGVRLRLDEELDDQPAAWHSYTRSLLESVYAIAILVDGPAQEVLDGATQALVNLFARRQRPVLWLQISEGVNNSEMFASMPYPKLIIVAAEKLSETADTIKKCLTDPDRREKDSQFEVRIGKNFIEPTTRARLLWVPRGTFKMGGDTALAEPEHQVTVSAYWIAETPVTNLQYEIFLKSTGEKEPPFWRHKSFSDKAQPVLSISWDDAMNYCKWLGRQSGLRVSLPTEAQWEFAARGPQGWKYAWGNDEPDISKAHYNAKPANEVRRTPLHVGSYAAVRGPFGTLDQAGNVWEWCLDGFDSKFYENSFQATDPVCRPTGVVRLMRGGCWESVSGDELRAASRFRMMRNLREKTFGFRIVVLTDGHK